jgi:hypothetical protein
MRNGVSCGVRAVKQRNYLDSVSVVLDCFAYPHFLLGLCFSNRRAFTYDFVYLLSKAIPVTCLGGL